jgi:hypothetical protein
MEEGQPNKLGKKYFYNFMAQHGNISNTTGISNRHFPHSQLCLVLELWSSKEQQQGNNGVSIQQTNPY